jgi:hypothetical protein
MGILPQRPRRAQRGMGSAFLCDLRDSNVFFENRVANLMKNLGGSGKVLSNWILGYNEEIWNAH